MTDTVLDQANEMVELWQLYQMNFYLQRMQRNLSIINTAPNAQIVTLIGGNLYSLAAQYYGDQSQWVIIARANGLYDPQLTGQNTLVIPPWNGVDTGGVLQ
jgi:hypothetical protein